MKKKMHPKIQWHLILYITVFILALLPMTNSAYAAWGDIVYENIYVWSNDWTSVTATRLKFQMEMGIGLDGGNIIADATINTVITKGEDGKLTYTASFEDPFSLQERTCIDLNDITNRWDFESDPASDGWSSDTEAVWHSNSTADCRSGQGCLAPAGNNMAYTPALRLPKNARLSFWASWPDSTSSSSSGNYPPGKEYNYVVVYCGTNKNEMKQIYRSEVPRQLYKHVVGGVGSQTKFYTTDYLQQNIDLSEYAGERVYLKFGFVNNKDEPSTGYIDDLTIHGQPLDISQAEITVSPVTYTGEALKPLPVVTLNGKTLLNDMDYTIV